MARIPGSLNKDAAPPLDLQRVGRPLPLGPWPLRPQTGCMCPRCRAERQREDELLARHAMATVESEVEAAAEEWASLDNATCRQRLGLDPEAPVPHLIDVPTVPAPHPRDCPCGFCRAVRAQATFVGLGTPPADAVQPDNHVQRELRCPSCARLFCVIAYPANARLPFVRCDGCIAEGRAMAWTLPKAP